MTFQFQPVFVYFLGPYPSSKSRNCFVFIVLDHLTKYVLLKAMPKATISSVVKFLIAEVIHKFGTSETIVFGNGKQLVCRKFAFRTFEKKGYDIGVE